MDVVHEQKGAGIAAEYRYLIVKRLLDVHPTVDLFPLSKYSKVIDPVAKVPILLQLLLTDPALFLGKCLECVHSSLLFKFICIQRPGICSPPVTLNVVSCDVAERYGKLLSSNDLRFFFPLSSTSCFRQLRIQSSFTSHLAFLIPCFQRITRYRST